MIRLPLYGVNKALNADEDLPETPTVVPQFRAVDRTTEVMTAQARKNKATLWLSTSSPSKSMNAATAITVSSQTINTDEIESVTGPLSGLAKRVQIIGQTSAWLSQRKT